MPNRPASFTPRRPGRSRKSAAQRGYDNTWRKVRAAFLVEHPVCQGKWKCNGDPATEVDHKTTIRSGGARLDWDNLQALCKRCHSYKTRTEDMP
ncbi:MAG: HNH endonuclease signature motif containing protein [Pseudomonadota bacterium]